MYCCTRQIRTPFCPYCGKEAKHKAIIGLFNYVQGRSNTVIQNLHSEALLGNYDSIVLKKRAISAAKWSEWLKALEKLLEEPKTEQNLVRGHDV